MMRPSMLSPVRHSQQPHTSSPVVRNRALASTAPARGAGGPATGGATGTASSSTPGSAATASSGRAANPVQMTPDNRTSGARNSAASPGARSGASRNSVLGSPGANVAAQAVARQTRPSKAINNAASAGGYASAPATAVVATATAGPRSPSGQRLRKGCADCSTQTEMWIALGDLSRQGAGHRTDSKESAREFSAAPCSGELTPETHHWNLRSGRSVLGPQGAVVRGGPVRVRHAQSPWDSLDPSTWPSPRVALGDGPAGLVARGVPGLERVFAGAVPADTSPPRSVRSMCREAKSRRSLCVLAEDVHDGPCHQCNGSTSTRRRVQALEDELASVCAERDKLRHFLTDLAQRLGAHGFGYPQQAQEAACSIGSVSTGCTPGGVSPVIATARLDLSELQAVLFSAGGSVGGDADSGGGDAAGAARGSYPSAPPTGSSGTAQRRRSSALAGSGSAAAGGEAIVLLTAGCSSSSSCYGSVAMGVATPPVAVAGANAALSDHESPVNSSSGSRSASVCSVGACGERRQSEDGRDVRVADDDGDTLQAPPVQQRQPPVPPPAVPPPSVLPSAATSAAFGAPTIPWTLCHSATASVRSAALVAGTGVCTQPMLTAQASLDRPHPRHVLRHSATVPVLPFPTPMIAATTPVAQGRARCAALPGCGAFEASMTGSATCPAGSGSMPIMRAAPAPAPPPTPRGFAIASRLLDGVVGVDRATSPQRGAPPPRLPRRPICSSGSASVPPPGRPPHGLSGLISPAFPGPRAALGERSCSPPLQRQAPCRSVSVTRRHFRQLWVLEWEEHLQLELPPGTPSS